MKLLAFFCLFSHVLVMCTISDVTSSEIEITIFLGKSNRIDVAIFRSKSDSFPITYHPRGTGDQCRRSQNGFYTPASPITPSVEELISSTPNIGAKKSTSNRH